MFSRNAIQMIDEKINHRRRNKITKRDSLAVPRVTAVATTALAAIALSGGVVAPASAATPSTVSAGTAIQRTSASVGASPFLNLNAQGGVGLGPGWANQPSGSFGTEDPADHISYVVQKNAVRAEAVEFRLVVGYTSSGWAKAIIMPDGEGSKWVIKAQGRGGSATNGLWAHQVNNGQVLTFTKMGFLGTWRDAIEIGYLEDLDPGDRVVFTWNKD